MLFFFYSRNLTIVEKKETNFHTLKFHSDIKLMINNHRDQTLYFSEHKYFQQTQVVYQGDIFWVFLCVFCLQRECVLMQGCFSAGVIPDETKALSLLAPANAVAGLLPGGGLLPTPNPLTQVWPH